MLFVPPARQLKKSTARFKVMRSIGLVFAESLASRHLFFDHLAVFGQPVPGICDNPFIAPNF